MNGPSTNWGHPVAYHPMLSHFFESVNAAIFFCQLRYWSDRTTNPLGVYKTSEEWTAETGLSYREQATARRILSEPGFVIETNKRLEHRIYFLIDWSAFNPAFEAWLEKNPPAPIVQPPNNPKRISPNDENAFRDKRNRRSSISTETTAETTAETISAAPTALPAVIEIQADPVNQKKASKAKTDDTQDTELQAACKATWATYVGEYRTRYGIDPVRNAKVNSNVKEFVRRIGHEEAPGVAAFYVRNVSDAFVVRSCHAMGALLRDAEAYRTQWATGQSMTATRAKQIDQSQANFSAVDEAMAIRRAKQQGAKNAQ